MMLVAIEDFTKKRIFFICKTMNHNDMLILLPSVFCKNLFFLSIFFNLFLIQKFDTIRNIFDVIYTANFNNVNPKFQIVDLHSKLYIQ